MIKQLYMVIEPREKKKEEPVREKFKGGMIAV
jgi:hypothetical protein